MSDVSVSVVIVSRNRPDDLRKCLRALKFQTLRPFEVVVVGNTRPPQDAQIKFVAFDEPNISAARNLGIEQSAGEIIAFIDDDAIAEPTWLTRLVAPLDDPSVSASGGFVRGRNGISFQWKAETIGKDGSSEAIEARETTVFRGDETDAIKLQGTNCAFRREPLVSIGGFDESFRFFLDEADVCLRLHTEGYAVAVVPDAEVQHGFAASALRGKDRRPTSLFEIAASHAYFVKKHNNSGEIEPLLGEQTVRLNRLLEQGLLEPKDYRKLKQELDAGLQDGKARTSQIRATWSEPGDFLPYVEGTPKDHVYLSCRRSDRAVTFQQARELGASGVPVTVLVLSLTSLYHRRWFHEDGFWVQTGGIFGKSTRSDRLFSLYSRSKRSAREIEMLKQIRD
ncbi:GT2 family glycosyltransferase [Litoreibacter ponti]|uniref:GT2 family glycosyltransferase n=1 Tax=Litoreibacter ponti TaxID=1510457 RepID=A0A2T6BPC7_9RHOB|nr:glycosyltransferase [Litoreibacter ponti]PTX57902.1 GT2 family glycosyltransferase [Litoreibacter ponti]